MKKKIEKVSTKHEQMRWRYLQNQGFTAVKQTFPENQPFADRHTKSIKKTKKQTGTKSNKKI